MSLEGQMVHNSKWEIYTLEAQRAHSLMWKKWTLKAQNVVHTKSGLGQLCLMPMVGWPKLLQAQETEHAWK